MTEGHEPQEEFTSQEEITSDDKLWAAIGYPIPLLPILVLLMEDKKDRPFLKFHAIQSLIFNLVLYVVITVIAIVTFGIGAFCAPIVWLAVFWPAYDSYNGNYTEIPVVTNLIKGQGWV